MNDPRRPIDMARAALVAALVATVSLPAAATTTFEGWITSTNGDVYVLLSPPVAGPVDLSDGGCSGNQCASGRLGGAAGLQRLNLSEQAGYAAAPATVQGAVGQHGQVRVVATAPGAPAFVDFTFDLWLDATVSGANLQGMAGATVGVSYEARGLMGGGGSGQYRVSQAWGSAAPPPLMTGFTLVGDHVLRGTLTHVAVGQWFELVTTLSGQVGTSGEARASFGATLSPTTGGPFAQLPAGLTLESPDWSIVDNQWCQSGCAPVPEPPVRPLALAGLIVLGCRRLAQQLRPAGERP